MNTDVSSPSLTRASALISSERAFLPLAPEVLLATLRAFSSSMLSLSRLI